MTDSTDRPAGPEPSGESEAPGAADDGAAGRKPAPARPTPVRDLMRDDPAGSRAPRFREVELDEGVWHVRVGGRHRSGTAPDHGAPLLLLFFHREPTDEEPELEVMAAARELDELSDHDLGELAARARPFRPVTESPDEEGRGRSDRPPRPRSRRGRSGGR